MKRRIVIALAALAVVLAVVEGGGGSARAGEGFNPLVTSDGDIRLPPDFRKNLVHLGSWFVPEGDASGFHDVYTEASSVDAYRRDGQFPDGATLVKELRPHVSAAYTTGNGVSHSTDEVKQWFVMIKDSKGRFEGNSNWGDGWGWALFKPGAGAGNVSKSYQADCMGCHVPARANDWVYVEGYPTLRSDP